MLETIKIFKISNMYQYLGNACINSGAYVSISV